MNETVIAHSSRNHQRFRLRMKFHDWLKNKRYDESSAIIGAILRAIMSVYHFHRKERFLNAIELSYRLLLKHWKLLPSEKCFFQRMFFVSSTLGSTGREIIKIPRGDNQFSHGLLQALSDHEEFEKYKRIIEDVQLDPSIGKHCAKSFRIRRDGGYVSEYIAGYNLAHLRNVLFDENAFDAALRPGLADAINALVVDLNEYRRINGRLTGDWALHNLIFSTDRSIIINVDLEGFYTYVDEGQENNFDVVRDNLDDIARYLDLLGSKNKPDKERVKVIKLLDEVRRGGSAYSGLPFLIGYHSIELDNVPFRGQRECSTRLRKIPFDFENKVVVDFGCNSGGMLFALAGTIKSGYGFDYNPKCINAALRIKKLNRCSNLNFYNFDLDNDSLETIPLFLEDVRIDICFLLSVCMWLERWREVIEAAARVSERMLFETNGTAEQQNAQANELRSYYSTVKLLDDISNDDPLQKERQLFLCSEKF